METLSYFILKLKKTNLYKLKIVALLILSSCSFNYSQNCDKQDLLLSNIGGMMNTPNLLSSFEGLQLTDGFDTLKLSNITSKKSFFLYIVPMEACDECIQIQFGRIRNLQKKSYENDIQLVVVTNIERRKELLVYRRSNKIENTFMLANPNEFLKLSPKEYSRMYLIDSNYMVLKSFIPDKHLPELDEIFYYDIEEEL